MQSIGDTEGNTNTDGSPKLGLGQGSDGALAAAESDQPIAVTMTTPNGVVEMETETIRIRRGTDSAVDHIDFFVNRPDLPAANEELRKAADELGPCGQVLHH